VDYLDVAPEIWQEFNLIRPNPLNAATKQLCLVIACILVKVILSVQAKKKAQIDEEARELKPKKKRAEAVLSIILDSDIGISPDHMGDIWATRPKRAVDPPKHSETDDSEEKRRNARIDSHMDLDIAFANKRKYI
jgi:hypothetical protein